MDSECSPGIATLAMAMKATCRNGALQQDCLEHELYPILNHHVTIHDNLVGMLDSQSADVDIAWAGLMYKVCMPAHCGAGLCQRLDAALRV